MLINQQDSVFIEQQKQLLAMIDRRVERFVNEQIVERAKEQANSVRQYFDLWVR